ncbi:MAG: hypothetical protein E2O93_03825 [Alphaproteobacteria bacterium]|nr:MAG: hypothetical protein E2O93_03825 [Alphaproteobacteria bacterium]
MKGGSVHILASKRDGTFYIGVTGDLPGRMAELPMLALFPDSPGATASKCWSGTSTTAASDLRHPIAGTGNNHPVAGKASHGPIFKPDQSRGPGHEHWKTDEGGSIHDGIQNRRLRRNRQIHG